MLCQCNNSVVLGDGLIVCSFFFPEVTEFRLPANTRDQLSPKVQRNNNLLPFGQPVLWGRCVTRVWVSNLAWAGSRAGAKGSAVCSFPLTTAWEQGVGPCRSGGVKGKPPLRELSPWECANSMRTSQSLQWWALPIPQLSLQGREDAGRTDCCYPPVTRWQGWHRVLESIPAFLVVLTDPLPSGAMVRNCLSLSP